jgi:CheY-like chemotaxis protein
MRGRLSARILVVDDQRANSEMLAEALRGRGYDVVTAPDGEAALEEVRAGPTSSSPTS